LPDILEGVFFQQPPAWSPIPTAALPTLIAQSVRWAPDRRPELRALLMRRYQADGCLLSASGTHALQVALSVLVEGAHASRCPVLLPAFTCYEVATAAVGARARVALYDVDPDTLEPDWDSVRRAGREGAAAFVVAPLFGMPIDWEEARRMADHLATPLVADVAQSHGASWRGWPAGSAADLIVLSFGRGKGWTGAGGGALLWRGSAPYVQKLRQREEGRLPSDPSGREVFSALAATSQFVFGRRWLYGIPASIPFLHLGETVYHRPTPPLGMGCASAALLIANDEASLREVSCRRNNAEEYTCALEGRRGVVTAVPGARLDASSGALRYPLRVRGGWHAVRAWGLRLGMASTYPTTLQELTSLEPLLAQGSTGLPGSQLLIKELVTLPTHSQTTKAVRGRLVELLSR
jgi:dTDP-4-amino-4,6-dideoxygalactose transaminase